ncbi:MAG: RNA polymerase sigma factor [Anaerolineales bacterium]|jgi:RNA polymerase sigma-70 factor (ECF subfamily)
MQEQEAIEQLKQGKIEGLEILVMQYQTRAIRAAFLILGDHELAEDIVADAFIRAYHHIDQFDTGRPFAPWFYQIVVNLARRAYSKQKRTVALQHIPASQLNTTETGRDESIQNPTEAAEQSETNDLLQQAVLKLTPKQRTVIIQKYFLGMSIEEIASNGFSSPGTVKWRLYAAKKKLKKYLSESGYKRSGSDE